MMLLTTSGVLGGAGAPPSDPVVTFTPSSTITSSRIMVRDQTRGAVLGQLNPITTFDPASLVKMMGALIIHDNKSGVLASETVTYNSATDDTPASNIHADGDLMTLEVALHFLIMGSYDDTASMLARHIGEFILGGSPTATAAKAAFVTAMNDRATALGMSSTTFNEETGSQTNTTTAEDLAILMDTVFSIPAIVSISEKETYSASITGPTPRSIQVDHTFVLSPRNKFGPAKTGGKSATYHSNVDYIAPNGNRINIGMYATFGDPELRFKDTKEVVAQALDVNPYLGDPISDGLVAPGNHQRWRIRIRDGGNSGTYHSSTCLRVLINQSGLPIDITAAMISANSERAGQPVENLINRFTPDWWGAEQYFGDDVSVEIDFGSGNEQEIGAIQWASRQTFADQSPRTFDVEYFSGGNWIKAWSYRGLTDLWGNTELRQYTAPYAATEVVSPFPSYNRWRLRMLRGANPTFLSVALVEMRSTVSGANIATGGTPIASTQRTGFEAAKAFDGLLGTEWSPQQMSTDTDPWIGYNFGSSVSVREVALTARDAFVEQMLRDFVVEGSNDGVTWTPVWAGYDYGIQYTASEQRVFAAPV